MSVQTSTSLVQYIGNASTETPYPVTFPFLEDSHLKVVVTDEAGIDTLLTRGTDYAVTGAGQPQGGSIVTTAALAVTYRLTIYREVPATQLTSYAENGEFPAASHEKALDKLTMLVQQNARSASTALRVPETRSGLPDIQPQPTTVLGFDGASNPVTYDSAALVAFLNLTQQITDRPTKTFVDAGARSVAVPDFLGQVGTQIDNSSLWISTGLVANAWEPVLSGTAYVNSAYIVVQTAASATANGAALLAAYDDARTLQPNGLARAADNRACLILPPANYDLGTDQLVLDAEYVDVIGLTTDRQAQSIFSATAATGQGVIRQTANDVVIQNLTLRNNCVADTTLTAADSAAYFPSSDLPLTKIRNVDFYATDDDSGIKPMRIGVTYSGRYEDCRAYGPCAFGGAPLDGVASGSTSVASGTFIRCRAGGLGFGGGTGSVLSGTCDECEGDEGSFGGGGGAIAATATLLNCRKTGDNLSTATTITSGARITNFHDPAGAHYYPVVPVNPGGVVQKVYAQFVDTSPRTNFTPQIPLDNTIPQKNEGKQVLAATITPKYADSKILISFQGFAVGGNMVTALFKNDEANAIAATYVAAVSGTVSPSTLSLVHQDTAGTTNPITYRIRAGSTAMYINGSNASARFGGTARTTLVLEEIKS